MPKSRWNIPLKYVIFWLGTRHDFWLFIMKSSETRRLRHFSPIQNISIDLRDAYLHVPLFPKHRQYLRFCIQGRCYQWKTLCFGPTSAPQVFTKIVSVVAAIFWLGTRHDFWLFIMKPSETRRLRHFSRSRIKCCLFWFTTNQSSR
jgi:hypothetical protein